MAVSAAWTLVTAASRAASVGDAAVGDAAAGDAAWPGMRWKGMRWPGCARQRRACLGQGRLRSRELHIRSVGVACDGSDILPGEPGSQCGQDGPGRLDPGGLGIRGGDRLRQHLVDVPGQVAQRLDADHLVVDQLPGLGAAIDDLLQHRVALLWRLRLVVIQLLADEERLPELLLGVARPPSDTAPPVRRRTAPARSRAPGPPTATRHRWR